MHLGAIANLAILPLLLAMLTNARPLLAEPELPMVVPGQVVVDYAPQTTVRRSHGMHHLHPRLAGYSVIRPLGSSGTSAVVGRSSSRVSSMSTSIAIAPLKHELSMCEELLATKAVVRCSPDYVYSASAVPNDLEYSSQIAESLGPVAAQQAWDIRTNADSVVVGVVDTGVDYNHPDLAANMWTNPGEVPANGVDDDGNGYIDDVYGVNAVADNGNPMDDNFHGTHCAGTIGAVGNNGTGVTGIAWSTKIMALKFMASDGRGFLSDAIETLDYVLAMKSRGVNIRVLNNSWGGGPYVQMLQDRIIALKDAGVVFVAAAGNNGSDNDYEPSYPANFDHAVSVAATKANDETTFFSSFGATTVDIGAPGNAILSTVPNGAYATLGGTSMAAPHVVGALTLLFAHVPSLTVDEAIERLYATADPVPMLEGITATGRRLNVANLLSDYRPAAPAYANCAYTLDSIPYAPPDAVSSAPRLIPNSRTINAARIEQVTLPFQFPFYDSVSNSVWVSINGLIYFREPVGRGAADWYWTPFGGPYSIAPLHHHELFDPDLNTILQPEQPGANGVRVLATSERVDIEWLVKLPPFPEKIRIVVSLFPDGRIEQYTSVPSNRVAHKLRQWALVSMRGGGTEDARSISFRGFPLVMLQNQAFAYRKGACSIPDRAPGPRPAPGTGVPPTPTPIQGTKIMTLLDHRGIAAVSPGKPFKLAVWSSRNLEQKLSFELNGTPCSGTTALPLEARTNTFTGKFPDLGRTFSRMTLLLPGESKFTPITKSKKKVKLTFASACRQVAKAFQRMQRD